MRVQIILEKALFSEARDEGHPAGISDTQGRDHFGVAERLPRKGRIAGAAEGMQFDTDLQEQTLFRSTVGQGLPPSLLGPLREGDYVAEQKGGSGETREN